MIEAAARFVRAVLAELTWQKLLLAQLLAGGLDIIATLLFTGATTPVTFTWSRLIIEETIAFSILFAALIAEQAVARGARPFQTYALAILAASVFAGTTQFQIRGWFGVYTNVDRPGVAPAVRRTQMIYVACDTLTYGVLFILVYLDHRRRERLLQRVRVAELERARSEQQLAKSRLTVLRADVDAAQLLTTLAKLQSLFDSDAPRAERDLDELIASLRAKLAPQETDQRYPVVI